jgi:hypothetical protein
MAFTNFTGGVANITPAAFQAVYIKTGSEKWQTLGAISNGVLNINTFSAPDSLTRNKAINSIGFSAKCRMMQSSSIALLLLDNICDGSNSFLFKMTDAATVTTSAAYAGWIYVTNSQVGCKGKVVADGTPEDNRYIELEWQGSIYNSDANETAMLKPTLQTADFEATGSGGTYHAIGLYTDATDGGNPIISQIRSCGVSSVTFDTSPASGAETISPIQNVKFTLEMLANTDGLRRFLPISLDISLEFDWMATLNSDLLLLGNAVQQDVKIIVTMVDSVVFTFDNRIGLESNFEVSGDMDKNRVVRWTSKGKTLQSNIDSIVS